jgi:hypothetical protein
VNRDELPDGGAAVGEFISIHTGDDGMAQVHLGDGVADTHWLIQIERGRAAGGDVAEPAAAGADIAQDHQRGGASCPALAHVGALGALADRMELLVVHQIQQARVAGAGGHLHLEPGRLATDCRVRRFLRKHQMVERDGHRKRQL